MGISSTKRRGSGTVELNGGWKIFHSGVDAAMSAQAGVGLLVSLNIAECVADWVPLGGRVCLLKLKLLERSLCVLQVYAPNIKSQYEAFLEKVEVALGKATSSESLVLLGDFNAHVGIDNATGKGVIGNNGDPDTNKSGRCLLQFCATNGLCIMNAFFQYKKTRKYTWYRDSLGQRSLIDFCIISADLFSTVSDIRVKRRAGLSTGHHLVVCTLKALKALKKRKTFRPRETYRIKWEPLADQEVGTAFAEYITSKFKNFRPLLKTFKLSGVCFEQQSLRPLLTVVDASVLEGRRVARKELLGGTKKLKELYVQKKCPIRPVLQISHHLNFVRSTLKHLRKKISSRLRGKRSRAAFFIEDSHGVTLKVQDAILNRWRDYFNDLLNPFDVTPIQIHEGQVGEDIQITEADVNAVIKSLTTGKAPGEDDLRPEMLKAMSVYGVRWLIRVCKVACSTGQAPKQWRTSVIISIHKRGHKRKCSNYRGTSLISVPGKVYAKCLAKKCREIIEPKLTDAQCGFRPGRNTMDQIFASQQTFEKLWEYAKEFNACFVDLQKA